MVIKGYELTSGWKVIGGMSEVAFARKDGRDWFIKKFITPKYPLPDSPGSEKTKERQRKKCEAFEKRHKDINGRIASCCGLGGNLIYAIDFFREGSCYYKINEKIDTEDMSISDICKLDNRNLLVIMRSLVSSLKILHNAKIVHGDLKPDNILIKLTSTGTYTTKLIDFDDSYISGYPPEDHSSLVGTPEYYSPELYKYIIDEEGLVSGKTLTTKSDMFALGIILAEYLTGSKPIIPDKYSGTYSAVADGAPISFVHSEHLTYAMERLLRKLLDLDPFKRPSIDEVFRSLPIPRSLRPKIIRFSASVLKAVKGSEVELSWAAENATTVTINGISVPLTGTQSFEATNKYILIAQDSTGKSVEQVIVIEIEEPALTKPTVLKGTLLKRHTK